MSSMKLHRDTDVTQKTAWFMQQRIREMDTIDQMVHIAAHLIGKWLMYRALIAD